MKRKYVQAMMTGMAAMLAVTVPVTTVAAATPEKEQTVYVDDETVIRMVGKGLGISMMSELMIRGNTDDVCCVPVTPRSLRELGMGTEKGVALSENMQKLKDCVLEYIREAEQRKGVGTNCFTEL